MYRPSFAFWYCVFLFVILSSGKNEEYWENFTSGDAQSDNSTMLYKLNANSMKNQDNETDLMRYNSRENSVKYKSETNSMLHGLNEHSNEDNNDNIVLYKMCNNTCIQHCCNLIIDNCYFVKLQEFPDNSNFTWEAEFAYSCEERELPFDIMDNENTMFFDNSFLNLSRHDILISLLSKCANILLHSNSTNCFAIMEQNLSIYMDISSAVFIASLLCLLMTFIVYSICPELQNIHGYTLRSYVASLFVVFTIILIANRNLFAQTYSVCVAASLLLYFCYFTSLLWQNAICFDILRTFGGIRFLRNSVKQSKRKIFLTYSFCVWGVASIYVIICAIMNFVPTVPDNMQPNICIDSTLGFSEDMEIVYFEIPISVLIICNICFLIFTMLNIVYATKNIDCSLKDAKTNHQTKQRSMTYLKLLLLADINLGLLRIFRWTSDIIIVSFNIWEFIPNYVLLILETIECVQSFIIFIIFVCKKRIWQLLLKRFGCEKLFVKRENINK
nr:PREDICTED: G-protein coupled receptor Mth2-like [Linepithema humile]